MHPFFNEQDQGYCIVTENWSGWAHSPLTTDCSVFFCLRKSEKETAAGRGTTAGISALLYFCQDANRSVSEKQGYNACFLPCILNLTFMLTITAMLSDFRNKAYIQKQLQKQFGVRLIPDLTASGRTIFWMEAAMQTYLRSANVLQEPQGLKGQGRSWTCPRLQINVPPYGLQRKI